MKNFLLILITAILLLVSCTTAQQSSAISQRLDLAQIQQFKYGEISTGEVSRLIGSPDQITQIKRVLVSKEAWIYHETSHGQSFERLGLLVDRQTNMILSATWSVRENDPYYTKNAVLAWFNTAKFTEKPVGPISKDFISDDVVLSDSRLGISIYVNGAKQTVQSITFEKPEK